jgi:hypothetical protein
MFYKPNNNIIIVDDVKADLDTLSNELTIKGIGNRIFKYPEDIPGKPMKGVRIAFFDIDINPSGGGSDGRRYNDLANAIKQFIDFSNGPFVLIFWTKNKEEIDRLKEYISEVHQDCPRPFLVSHIDKADFTISPQENLQQILDDPILELLFDFEGRAFEAASETISQIYDIIPKDADGWGENEFFKANFERVFSKIATSSLGFGHAQKNPDKAVYEALIPVLSHKIVSNNSKGNKWALYLNTLKNATTSNIEVPNFKYSSLNSIFHLDTTSQIDHSTRGAVFVYNYDYRVTARSRLDFFEELNKQSKDVFSRFVQFNDTISEGEKDSIRGKTKFVIIEISAVCDYSQNKLRNHKFVLALLTPAIKNNQINGALINEAVFYKDLPVLHFDGNDYRLWVNFNFSVSDFQITNNIGDPLFILKKEIVDMIGNRYANHVSRIGITSF